jgi:hypothetical protein
VTEPPVSPGIPQPFAPAPTQPRAGGCGKPVLVGCGVAFLLLGVAAALFIFNAKRVLVWSLTKAKQQVVANLPADVAAADRDRFERAFTAAVAGIQSDRLDPAALQGLQSNLLRVIQKPPGELTREDLLALTESLERLGGVAPVEEGTPPPLGALQLEAPRRVA